MNFDMNRYNAPIDQSTTTLHEALRDESARERRRTRLFQYAQVLEVFTHRITRDPKFDVVTVMLLDEPSNDVDCTDGSIKAVKKPIITDVHVGQHFIGNGFGSKWLPRVGDIVLLAWVENSGPVILCTLPHAYHEPVTTRTAALRYEGKLDPEYPNRHGWETNLRGNYDKVFKWCQDLPNTLNKIWDGTFKNHHMGEHPLCAKITHDLRDMLVAHECILGHKNRCEGCSRCDNLIETRNSENQNFWAIVTSSLEEAIIPIIVGESLTKQCRDQRDPPSYTHVHFPSGSRICAFSKDHNLSGSNYSVDVPAKEGRMWFENMVNHVFKGHFGLHPDGTFRASSRRNLNTGENDLATISAYGTCSEDPDKMGLIELLQILSGAFIRIWKDGKIALQTGSTKIELLKDGKITIQSPTEVEIVAPTIKLNGNCLITGDTIIGGSLSHGNGPCCSSGEGWLE